MIKSHRIKQIKNIKTNMVLLRCHPLVLQMFTNSAMFERDLISAERFSRLIYSIKKTTINSQLIEHYVLRDL